MARANLSQAPKGARAASLAWSEDDVATLFRLRAKGMSWPAISRFLKRPQSACQARHKLTHSAPAPLKPPDLLPPRWPPALVAEVLQLRADGLTWPQIGLEIGRSPSSSRDCYIREQRRLGLL